MSIQSQSLPSNNNNNNNNNQQSTINNQPYKRICFQQSFPSKQPKKINVFSSRCCWFPKLPPAWTKKFPSQPRMMRNPWRLRRRHRGWSWKDGGKCVNFDGRKEPKSWTMVVLGWRKMKKIVMNEVRLIGGVLCLGASFQSFERLWQ